MVSEEFSLCEDGVCVQVDNHNRKYMTQIKNDVLIYNLESTPFLCGLHDIYNQPFLTASLCSGSAGEKIENVSFLFLELGSHS